MNLKGAKAKQGIQIRSSIIRIPTFSSNNYSACDKSETWSVTPTDNYRDGRALLRRMLSFIFATRNKPVEGAVRRHGYTPNGCLREYGVRGGGTRVPTWFPNETASPRVRNRDADVSRFPRLHPRFMGVRANLCVPRETCIAPASPPTARISVWDRTWPTTWPTRSHPVQPAIIHHRKKRSSPLHRPLTDWI